MIDEYVLKTLSKKKKNVLPTNPTKKVTHHLLQQI